MQIISSQPCKVTADHFGTSEQQVRNWRSLGLPEATAKIVMALARDDRAFRLICRLRAEFCAETLKQQIKESKSDTARLEQKLKDMTDASYCLGGLEGCEVF